jgi:hypothetical protein
VKATKIAREIRAIIPGSLSSRSSLPILRKGIPPYKKTIIENTGTIRLLPVKAGIENPKRPCMNEEYRSTGTDRAVETKNFSLNIIS